MVTVSERRLEANRRNAARSTGPRTPEGHVRGPLRAARELLQDVE